MEKTTWILVTRNKGKAAEIEQLFRGTGIHFLTLDDIGFAEEIEETGATFEENARIKAEALGPFTDLPVLADDSGLAVDFLGGKPGVHSARFAGEKADDAANRKKLITVLSGAENRNAGFICVLAYKNPKNGSVRFFRGECRGRIGHAEAGSCGFGYDSLFIPEGHSRTFAELGDDIKQALSHRGQAVQKLLDCLSALG